MKAINDTHGHAAGDTALTTAASILRDSFRRPGDIIARLGGDEFAVQATCGRGTDNEPAILARLETSTARENKKRGLPFPVAISFGVVQLETGETLEQLMERADSRMYEIKGSRKMKLAV